MASRGRRTLSHFLNLEIAHAQMVPWGRSNPHRRNRRSPTKANTSQTRAAGDSGTQRSIVFCSGDGRSSAVSSEGAKIFYHSEFVDQSSADLWPEATKSVNKEFPGGQDGPRSDRDILTNRASLGLTMDISNERAAMFRERGSTAPVEKRRNVSSPDATPGTSQGRDAAAIRSTDKKPPQRFRPTCTDKRSDAPSVTPNSALRTYMTRHTGSMNGGTRRREIKSCQIVR